MHDIINTGILIANFGVVKNDDDKRKLGEIKTGINQFNHFVFDGKFGVLEAQVACSKAAYLAAIVLSDFKGELRKFNTSIPLTEYLITQVD